jgi:hypothetical protein
VTKQQIRWVIVCAAVVLGILLFIVAKWLVLVLLGGLVLGWIVFATESAKEQSAPAHPSVPVYHPPVQPAAAEQPASYAQGYQAQLPLKSAAVASFPFTSPSSAEPQPHEARPGERYEDPLVQYPDT